MRLFTITCGLMVLLLSAFPVEAVDPEITIIALPHQMFEGAKIMFELKGVDSHRLRWEFGDGAASVGGQKANHVYKERGVYKVIVTDLEGKLDAPLEKRLTILKEGREVLVPGGVLYPGVNVKLKVRKFIKPTVRWDMGDGTVKTGGWAMSHMYKTAGVFTVKVTDYAGQGDKQISAAVTVSADNRSLILPRDGLAGEPVDVQLKNTAGGDFHWLFSDGQRASGTSLKQKIFHRAGTVNVTVEDRSGKYPPLKGSFTVKPDRRELKSSDSFALPEEALEFDALHFRGPVKWDFGDGTVKTGGSGQEPHAYNKPGRYTVTVRDENGKSPKTFTQNVTVGEFSPGFNINLLEVSFSGGKYYRVTSKKGHPPSYYVKIKAAGRGILKGRWILDGHPVELFSVTLLPNRVTELRGNQVPLLPLTDTGDHYFTLEFTNYPPSGFQRIPFIRYFVTETGEIVITSPAPGAKVSSANVLPLKWEWESRFKKEDLRYQLLVSEIPVQFLTQEQVTAAWKTVGSGNRHQLDVSGFKRGAWIYWQVRAVSGRDNKEVLTISNYASFKLTK